MTKYTLVLVMLSSIVLAQSPRCHMRNGRTFCDNSPGLAPKIHTPRDTVVYDYQSYNGPANTMECYISDGKTKCKTGTHKP
jgi:hypothetical protein